MGTKKKVLLYIDAETILTAKELGLNLSKVSENALKDAIRRMREPNSRTMPDGGTQNIGEWTGGDLNPRPPECKSGVHTKLNYRPKHFLSEENCVKR